MTERILRALAREVVGEVRARRRRVVAARVALIVTNNLFYPLLPPSSTILVVEAFLGGPGLRETRTEISCNVQGPQFCIYTDIIRRLLRCRAAICSRIYHRPVQEGGELVVTSSVCIRVRVEHDWNGDVEGGWNEFGGSEINSVFRFFFFFLNFNAKQQQQQQCSGRASFLISVACSVRLSSVYKDVYVEILPMSGILRTEIWIKRRANDFLSV